MADKPLTFTQERVLVLCCKPDGHKAETLYADLKVLTQRGLVEAAEAPGHGRWKVYRATAEGRRLAKLDGEAA